MKHPNLIIEKIACPTDTEWHALRKGKITASTAGALFPPLFEQVGGELKIIAEGAMGFTTPFKLYHVLGGLYTEEDISGNDAIKRGNLIEKLGVHIIADSGLGFTDVFYNDGADRVFYQNKKLRIGATPDFICKDKDGMTTIIQLKSVERGIYRDKWMQEDGTPKIPNWIFLQATIEAFMVALEMGINPLTQIRAFVLPVVVSHAVEAPFLPVALGESAQEVWDDFIDLSGDFHKIVEQGLEPKPDFENDGDTLDGLYPPKFDKVIDLTLDPQATADATRYNQAREIIRAETREQDIIKNRNKYKMKDAEIALLSGGRRIKWVAPKAKETRIMRMPKFETERLTQSVQNNGALYLEPEF